ncbi:MULTISPECIES: mechanosensitive ion channel family protein [Neptunomonas]|jgi:small conductance mechanosensitive channel|uniref:Small-conductance mechanosensitive channel n=3 Tax=Neptunomonas phycophila TaxID=1572645 RepID=A0AAW7XEW1_9GAMM|nr:MULTISPECIES: mechanosensitive ion channel domain-containing protein [Neptunomonas]MBT3146750.1 mechanosensitive ion channel [Neptunomonas phycophila]MDN2661518.1 mechanosensitive ion channel [Neptunomonas sp. CHC150]MDO6452540.1 mechanosensitive ion channel [Neptunomonas phycophila]QLE98195.1 mechanosensitive ion channel [Neptunomonas phycophila]
MDELFQNFFDPSTIEGLQNDYIVPWAINIVMALAVFIIGRLVISIILAVINKLLGKTKMDSMLVNFVMSIMYALLLLFVIVASLDQLGVNTSSLIALVGAAGLAIGLSLQDSLKNFAAGVMLVVFRPFREGEFVEVNGISGTAERITIFNTIMRTGDGREVTIPNGPIYGNVITNFSRRDTRRVDMVFGIGYDSDLLKAKAILKEIVETDERVLSEPAPLVAVQELADSSVNFVVRPWAKTSDYWDVYRDTMEKVKLRFDAEGISIPFPQMDVHLIKEESAANSPKD